MSYYKNSTNSIYKYLHKPFYKLEKKFRLENGKFIYNPEIAYKTYGKLNKKKIKCYFSLSCLNWRSVCYRIKSCNEEKRLVV